MSMRGKIIQTNRVAVSPERRAMEIHVRKDEAHGLPWVAGQRVPVRVRILPGEQVYQGGLRTTPDTDTAYICPDLYDESNAKVRLSHVLGMQGYARNDAVDVSVSQGTETVVTIRPR